MACWKLLYFWGRHNCLPVKSCSVCLWLESGDIVCQLYYSRFTSYQSMSGVKTTSYAVSTWRISRPARLVLSLSFTSLRGLTTTSRRRLKRCSTSEGKLLRVHIVLTGLQCRQRETVCETHHQNVFLIYHNRECPSPFLSMSSSAFTSFLSSGYFEVFPWLCDHE